MKKLVDREYIRNMIINNGITPEYCDVRHLWWTKDVYGIFDRKGTILVTGKDRHGVICKWKDETKSMSITLNADGTYTLKCPNGYKYTDTYEKCEELGYVMLLCKKNGNMCIEQNADETWTLKYTDGSYFVGTYEECWKIIDGIVLGNKDVLKFLIKD